MSDLPVEMLEAVLMRAYLMLYQTDIDAGDDDCRPCRSGKSSSSEFRAFTLLASVCSSWYYTLMGWPDSPACLWVRHQLKKLIEREYYNGLHHLSFLFLLMKSEDYSSSTVLN